MAGRAGPSGRIAFAAALLAATLAGCDWRSLLPGAVCHTVTLGLAVDGTPYTSGDAGEVRGSKHGIGGTPGSPEVVIGWYRRPKGSAGTLRLTLRKKSLLGSWTEAKSEESAGEEILLIHTFASGRPAGRAEVVVSGAGSPFTCVAATDVESRKVTGVSPATITLSGSMVLALLVSEAPDQVFAGGFDASVDGRRFKPMRDDRYMAAPSNPLKLTVPESYDTGVSQVEGCSYPRLM